MGQPRICLSFPAWAAQDVWSGISGTFAKIRFKAGEEDHSIWIDVQNNTHRIMIASTPREALTQLGLLNTEVDQHFTGHPQHPALRNHLTQALRLVRQEMQALEQKARRQSPGDDPASIRRRQLKALTGTTTLAGLENIKQHLAPVFAALGRSTDFSAPLVGLHPVPNPPGYIQVDLGRRESHHVPAYQLSQVYGETYEQLHSGLQRIRGLNPDPASQTLLGHYQQQLLARQQAADAASGSRGVGMWAILMHANTHRLDPAIGLHTAAMAKTFLQEIKQEAQAQQAARVVILSKTGFAVNAKTQHWRGFLNACFQHLTGHAPVHDFIIEAKSAATSSLGRKIATLGWAQAKLEQMDQLTFEEYQQSFLRRINGLVETSFKHAFANGINVVKASLRQSKYDGTPQQIQQAITLLSDVDKARESWDILGITPDIEL